LPFCQGHTYGIFVRNRFSSTCLASSNRNSSGLSGTVHNVPAEQTEAELQVAYE
jgi:hypothetical protein